MTDRITIRVDTELVDAAAAAVGMSRSDFVRHALESYIQGAREADELREKLDALAEAQTLDRLRLRRSFNLLTRQVCLLTKEDPEALKKLVLGIWGGGE